MTARSRQRPARTAGMSAKEEILARLRTALDVPRPDEITTAEDIPRDYQRADHKQETSTDPTKIRNLLVRRLEDYTAVVHRTTSSQAPAAIATALGDAEQVVVPTALPPEWTRELNARVVPDAGTHADPQLAGTPPGGLHRGGAPHHLEPGPRRDRDGPGRRRAGGCPHRSAAGVDS